MDQRELSQDEVSEAIEHRDVLLDVRAILGTGSGRNFFKYFFKYYSITDLPYLGLEGPIMFEKMGHLRLANSVFQLVAEANPEIAAQILADVEKKKHARLYNEAKI